MGITEEQAKYPGFAGAPLRGVSRFLAASSVILALACSSRSGDWEDGSWAIPEPEPEVTECDDSASALPAKFAWVDAPRPPQDWYWETSFAAGEYFYYLIPDMLTSFDPGTGEFRAMDLAPPEIVAQARGWGRPVVGEGHVLIPSGRDLFLLDLERERWHVTGLPEEVGRSDFEWVHFTGKEFLLWGGADSAALRYSNGVYFEPVERSFRTAPAYAPAVREEGVSDHTTQLYGRDSVWTSEGLVVVSSETDVDLTVRLLRRDDVWESRSAPAGIPARSHYSLLAAGNLVYMTVLFEEISPLHIYDAATDRWTRSSPPDASPFPGVLLGDWLYFPHARCGGTAYHPRTDQWLPLSGFPGDSTVFFPQVAGASLILPTMRDSGKSYREGFYIATPRPPQID